MSKFSEDRPRANHLDPETMELIEIALREEGFNVTARDLSEWHLRCMHSADDPMWDEYVGRVRNEVVTMALTVTGCRLPRASDTQH